uniref:Protein prenyltransferase alpha subunit repeat containing 1 n=1 Tax=Tetraodon nigroviridis TaxID=99883 RepID=H3DNE0_TETNG
KMADSEEEVDVLVQRVVKDISNAFKRNPNIDEIGVIPCPEARCNRSPIVLVENKLGVESWCIKLLLPYVHHKLLLYRQRKHWLDRDALVDVTSTLLLLNPDFTTAWNVRKELLQCGVLTPEKDLYLGKLALTKFPKSPETWIHRRWVLQQLLLRFSPAAFGETGTSPPPDDQLTRTLGEEMKVCRDAACRYPSNYNAWSHRIWVLQRMARGSVKLLHDELSSTRPWVSMHVSDHSGFHYRQFLLQQLTAELSQAPPPSARSGPAQPEATGSWLGRRQRRRRWPPPLPPGAGAVLDLIRTFPGHETLWSHRRHIFYLWHLWRRGLQPGCSCNGDATLPAPDPPELRQTAEEGRGPPDPPSLASERSFVSGVLDGCCDREQKRFAAAYQKWIDAVVGQ